MNNKLNAKTLESLPDELLLAKLIELRVGEINELCMVNKKFKTFCDKNKGYIYRKLLERDFMIKLDPTDNKAKLLYLALSQFSDIFDNDDLIVQNPYFSVLVTQANPEIIVSAIRNGNITIIKQMLDANPALISLVHEIHGSLLHVAIQSDLPMTSKKAVIQLLMAYPQFNQMNDYINSNGETALILCSKQFMDNTILSKLIQSSKKINQQDKDGFTALMYYLKSRDFSQLIYLEFLKYGADITLNTIEQKTVFHFAIKSGNYTVVRDLYEKYFKNHLDHITFDQQTYLHYAAKYYQEDTIELILSHAPELINIPDFRKNTPLHIAASSYAPDMDNLFELNLIPEPRIKNTFESLIINGANVNQQNYNGRTPFMDFVANFSDTVSHSTFTFVLNLMISKNANFDLVDETGYNILHYFLFSLPDLDDDEAISLYFKNLNEVLKKCLVKHITHIDKEGNTPLFSTLKKNYTRLKETYEDYDIDLFIDQLMSLFKSFGYDFKIKDRRGRTIKTYLSMVE